MGIENKPSDIKPLGRLSKPELISIIRHISSLEAPKAGCVMCGPSSLPEGALLYICDGCAAGVSKSMRLMEKDLAKYNKL